MRALCRSSFVPTLAAALAPAVLTPTLLAAQGAGSGDSVLRSAGLAGTVPVSLNAVIGRYEGAATAFGVGGAAVPFLTDHVQVGVGLSYSHVKVAGNDASHAAGAALQANYVFGGGARWRGYAGGYAGGTDVSSADRRSVTGVQAGALYFLDPAVAVQAEYSYGRSLGDLGSAYGRVTVGLQPFVFGRAGYAGPAPSGLGTADVAFEAFGVGRDGFRGASALFAPYLTRWLQVGGQGDLTRARFGYASDVEGIPSTTITSTGRSGRLFARAYLPLARRVQPFAGGFVGRQSTNTNGYRYGLTSYGPALGVRYFLNRRVALDGALQREFFGDYTGAAAGSPGPAAQTTFSLGLATRLGQAR